MNVIEVDNSAIPLVDLAATGYNYQKSQDICGYICKESSKHLRIHQPSVNLRTAEL